MALDDKIINLDINKTNILNLNAKQYDTTGARSFTFRLLKGGQIFDLTGLTVRVGGAKADGTTVFNDCTIVDAKNGTVRVDLTTQMQTAAGNLNLELIIMQGTTRLSTVPFQINIVKSATNLNDVVSSDELESLNNALYKVDNVYSKKEIDDKVFSMANMGQDVREAMTGGSVAVVGNDAVLTNNIADKQITEPKMNIANYKPSTISAYSLVDFDLDNHQVIFPKGEFNIATTKQSYTLQQDLTIKLNNNGQINYIVFNTQTYEFRVLDLSNFSKITPDETILATVWGEHITTNMRYAVNGVPAYVKDGRKIIDNDISENSISLNKILTKDLDNLSIKLANVFIGNAFGNPIDFNFETKKITIPRHTHVLANGERLFYNGEEVGNIVIDFSSVNSGTRFFIFDTTKKTFEVVADQFNTKNNITIATWWENVDARSLVSYYPCYTINGEEVDRYRTPLSSYVKKDDLKGYVKKTDTEEFDKVKNRLLAPPMMYFVDGEEMPIYKEHLFYDNEAAKNNDLVLINKAIPTRYDYINKMKYINPDRFTSGNIMIGIEQNIDQNIYLYNNTVKKSCNANAKKGKTINYLPFGDSISNRGIAKHTSEKLKSMHGVTVNCVGTIISSDYRGECREGWEFTNFVGQDNWYGLDNSHESYNWAILPDKTNFETDPTGSYSHWNPFIKLATDEDKASHPDWCFRNTGKGNELSYSQDSDKTGDFYIFDMDYYMSNHNIAKPDVITIALGRNDILQQYDIEGDRNTRMRFCLNLMVNQIKKALPNVKIGIIPDIYNEDNDWIESCMQEIKLLQESFTDIYCVPVWVHMNGYWGFATKNETMVKEGNTMQQADLVERTHIIDFCYDEYSTVVKNFILNVI